MMPIFGGQDSVKIDTRLNMKCGRLGEKHLHPDNRFLRVM